MFTWIFQQTEGSPVSDRLQSNPGHLHVTDCSLVQFHWNDLTIIKRPRLMDGFLNKLHSKNLVNFL